MTDAELNDVSVDDSAGRSSSAPHCRPASDSAARPGVVARLLGGAKLLPRRTVIFLIELYRTWVSPLRLPTCRFEPTCSGYAVEALDRHGFVYGSFLAIVRLLKCGPWHKPGYDPVPDRGLRELAGDMWRGLRSGDAVGYVETADAVATADAVSACDDHRLRNHQHASPGTRAL